MYSHDLIEQVLANSDIVDVISSYIEVIKKGRSFVAICPFHDDKNPSLSISREKQIFKCFVCGTGGNAISFVSKYEKIGFDAAVRKVAQISGFSDPRLVEEAPKIKVSEDVARLYSTIDDLQVYYRYGLSIDEGKSARDYLAKRNIPADQIEKYGLGYAPLDGALTVKYLTAKKHSLKDVEGIGIGLIGSSGLKDSNAGRLIFPLYNPNGQVVGFSARQLIKSDSGKYINSPETKIFHKGKLLYNYHRVTQTAHRDGYCYLVEGFMDVMALDKAGIPNAIALCGTALTSDQVELLRKLRCEIRLCLDGDLPGQMAMMKAIPLIRKAGIPVRVVDYGSDLRDPDDILQADGAEVLKARMNRLISPIDFQISYYANTKPIEKSEDRVKVLNAFLPYLKTLKPGIEFEDALVKIAKATGYQTDAIRSMLSLESNNKPDGKETPTYVKAQSHLHGNPINEKKYEQKLAKAERMVLYYMLREKEAVDFFEKNIGSFYDQIYEDCANFIIDYTKSHETGIDVSGLIASVESSGIANAEEIKARLLSLDDEKHGPLEAQTLRRYAEAIEEEKGIISAELKAETALGANSESLGSAIDDIVKARREALKKKTSAKGE